MSNSSLSLVDDLSLPDHNGIGVAHTGTLSLDLLEKMDAHWRAANYLSVAQIYLYDNPPVREPREPARVKPLVFSHWGTTPGQKFNFVHLNRVIKKYDLDMFSIAGRRHGGPALVGNTYLEGTYSELYLGVTQDEAGMKRLFTLFSFPGGISSYVAPTTPGPSTKAASSAIRSATPSARRSTTLVSSSRA